MASAQRSYSHRLQTPPIAPGLQLRPTTHASFARLLGLSGLLSTFVGRTLGGYAATACRESQVEGEKCASVRTHWQSASFGRVALILIEATRRDRSVDPGR